MMMDYEKLKAELLAGHPGTGAYDADNAIAAGQLNAVNRSRFRDAMSGDEIFCQANEVEFAALAVDKRNIWVSFCGRDVVNAAHAANVDFVKWVFGDPSATLTALQAARTEAISRAVELGLGWVKVGHVQLARV